MSPGGELRGANPSTRGLGWANLWCTGCYANSSAGQLSWYGRTAAPREILLYTSSRTRFLNRTSIGERCKHRELELVLGRLWLYERKLAVEKSLSLPVPGHRCVHRRGNRNASCSAGVAWSESVAGVGVRYGRISHPGKPTLLQEELCYASPIPIERKSCLVIPRLQHIRSLTPRAAAAVSRTDRRLTCTGRLHAARKAKSQASVCRSRSHTLIALCGRVLWGIVPK
nr:photosystem I PsaA/PsaB [Tanacetum cinerariifolium]